jgi:hypothetical protein
MSTEMSVCGHSYDLSGIHERVRAPGCPDAEEHHWQFTNYSKGLPSKLMDRVLDQSICLAPKTRDKVPDISFV